MLLWDAEGANQWPWKHVCVTLFNLVLSRSSQYFGESKPDRGKKMAKGDYCAVFGCNNDRKFPEKYVQVSSEDKLDGFLAYGNRK